MNHKLEPLINDRYTGEPPSKRAVAYIQSKREQGMPVAGLYCSYAPVELIHAMGMVPAILCAFAKGPIKAAEEVLPANLCPLIKSSYGFIMTDTCPFFSLSEAVIGETTCDGKKKMFELISDKKPMHVMDLPQKPDEDGAVENWSAMIKKLQGFLEANFNRKISDSDINKAIEENNKKSGLMRKIFDYAALDRPVISWEEMYEICFVTQIAYGRDIVPVLEGVIEKLEKRKNEGARYGKEDSYRVLVTGSPVGGDSSKIYRIIEELGGIVVAMDSCTGMKPFMFSADSGTADPYRALSEKYLKIPCSCMTPNTRRMTELDALIEKFKPHAVVDFVLHACHSYNIESHKVGEHVKNRFNIPFLKIVSDYSDSDIEQIRTRVEAVLENI